MLSSRRFLSQTSNVHSMMNEEFTYCEGDKFMINLRGFISQTV